MTDMKTVVITGSTRGIGKGLAREFLRLGHRVVVIGRSPQAVEEARVELAAMGDVVGCTCDVRSIAALETAWETACARFSRVDIWINNAAIAPDRAPLAQIPGEQIAATVETNLLGAIYGTKVALAGMLRQGGGSIYTFEGFGSNGMTSPGLTTYGTTKSALRYFTKSVAKEIAGTPMLIGSLSPGMVATDLLVYSSRSADAAEWARAKRMMNILGDTVETVTPWLAAQALANRRQGARIEWLTPGKAALRFATALLRRRDIIGEFERRGDIKVR